MGPHVAEQLVRMLRILFCKAAMGSHTADIILQHLAAISPHTADIILQGSN
jgi:hypothetical protein